GAVQPAANIGRRLGSNRRTPSPQSTRGTKSAPKTRGGEAPFHKTGRQSHGRTGSLAGQQRQCGAGQGALGGGGAKGGEALVVGLAAGVANIDLGEDDDD